MSEVFAFKMLGIMFVGTCICLLLVLIGYLFKIDINGIYGKFIAVIFILFAVSGIVGLASLYWNM